jgi:nitrate reductase gamma subunit
VSRFDVFLWVAFPYLCIATFVVGHVWRYRRDQYTWTARSTQLLERRLLMPGILLFHLGILAAIGGHLLGILVPRSWTDAIGIHEHLYHWISVVAGGTAGAAVVAGIVLLFVRRTTVPRVRATTSRSDLVLYPVLVAAIVLGALATYWGNGVDRFAYRETVSPWFRGIFSLDPRGELMADASFVFQAHAVSAWLLFAVWPFTRLVHAWSVPVGYLRRSPILYRSRSTGPSARPARPASGPGGVPVAHERARELPSASAEPTP